MIAAVLLAAGQSIRMGRSKLELPLRCSSSCAVLNAQC